MGDEPVIQLEHVWKVISGRVALRDVTATVPSGCCFVWLGAGGSGKSTLLRLMLGLCRPTRGRIRLLGRDVPGGVGAALPRVGTLVDEPRFYPYLTGRQNLEVWAAHYGAQAKSRVDEVAKKLGIGSSALDHVGGYRNELRKRLALARALLNDPEVLILDEPTRDLGPAWTAEVRALLRSFCQVDGHTVIITTALIDEAEELADQVAILHDGQLLSEVGGGELGGSPGALAEHYLEMTMTTAQLGDHLQEARR